MTHQRDQRRSLNSSWENELTKSRFNRFTFYHTLFLLLLLFLLHFFGFSSLLAPLRLSNKRKPAIARVGQKWAAKPTKHRQHGQQQRQQQRGGHCGSGPDLWHLLVNDILKLQQQKQQQLRLPLRECDVDGDCGLALRAIEEEKCRKKC